MIFPNQCLGEVTLNFGIYVAEKPTETVKQVRPLLNILQLKLSKILSVPVTIKINMAKDYKTGIENLVSGKVDFTRLGPASYVEAKRNNPNISLLVMESKNGKSEFLGIICVAANSSIKNIKDLRGKTFAFGSQYSTIGRYLSQDLLWRNDIFVSDLASYEYLDRHDKVGAAVAIGNFDAGALKEGTFNKLKARGMPLRSIASMPNVTHPWIARSGLDEKIESALRQSLLNTKDKKALKAIKRNGFLPVTDNDYDTIRLAIKNNDQFFSR
jgi:phosphonate transport system substrate-binding protein